MKALGMIKSTSGCDFHRIKTPFDCQPGVVDNLAYKDLPNDDIIAHITASELIAWNRVCPVKHTVMESQKIKYGFKTIVDMDDHWDLYFGHILYNNYHKNNVPALLKSNMFNADAVTVTTQRLKNEVLKYNPKVCVIPNALPSDGQFIRKAWPDKMTFIYVAGSSHGIDIQELSGPMKRIAGERWISENANFILAGYQKSKIWDSMEKIFSANGKLISYSHLDGLPFDHYMDHYEKATCAIVPLQFNKFNSFKSNLKILEAGMKKMPVICSFVPPYSDDPDAPVLWVKNKSDWYNHIKWVIKNPDKALNMGEELYKWVNDKYNFEYWNSERFKFYQEVIG